MELTFLIIILVILLAGLAAIFWFLKKRLSAPKNDEQPLLMLQNQINEVVRTLDSKLSETHKLSREITTELTKVGEGQKQVVDIAKQLENLQDILKNPKQRGVLGEVFLKTVLENVFGPDQFRMQYEFKDGTKVDAVIFVQKDKIIPVDSKFSLENYNRLLETKDEVERQRLESAFRDDLKNRIDETAKYIKPEEETMEFAFMFIPSEAVYYDLLVNKIGAIKSNTRDLIQYAGEKKVMIVSPTTFLAYLQTVLQGLKALKIEESAKQIAKRVGDLSKHLLAVDEYMKKLGVHLGTTVGMYGKAYKELGKIDKDVLKISGKAAGIKPMALEKPREEEEEEMEI